MNIQSELARIEREIDRRYERNPDDPKLEELEAKADELAEEQNKIDDAFKKREQEAKAAHKAKLNDILNLEKLGKLDIIIDKYGGDFIDYYHVSNLTVTSSVSDGQWTCKTDKACQKKIRQLVLYHVYNHYFRDK